MEEVFDGAQGGEEDNVEGVSSFQPVSPMGMYLNSSILSIAIVVVLESEIPIDDSSTFFLLRNVFLPINPRFSSIMVEEKDGVKKWKRVKVNLENHINTPTFPKVENPPYLYDDYVNNYLSNIASSRMKEDQPLWEIHIIKYATISAAGHLVFKLHHSLGDGYSLMGALLSCLQRADDPSLPLTFPSLQASLINKPQNKCSRFLKCVSRAFSGVSNTFSDFGWDMWKTSVLKDDISPLRSGVNGVEFNAMDVTTVTFCLDRIKEIKSKLNVTVNDVMSGVVFYGCRLYMEQTGLKYRKSHLTTLVLLNIRNIDGYRSVAEMVKPNSETHWGNNFAFTNIVIPKLSAAKISDPLKFVYKANKMIKRKKTSVGVYLIGQLLETMRKWRGPEVTSKYIYKALRNSSFAMSNVIGPVEEMALSGHPVKGIYYFVPGCPQSMVMTMVSYAGKLRIGLTLERDFIQPLKFKACLQDAFEIIFKAASASDAAH